MSANLAAFPAPSWSAHELSTALEQGEIVPFFQPKMNLSTCMVEGVEALARWIHPCLGTLSGDRFVEVMERLGLIDGLTDQVFRRSLQCVREWRDKGAVVNIAMNFSTLTLERTHMAAKIRNLVDEFGLPHEQVTIEVTETSLAVDSAQLHRSLDRLRDENFKVSADDFGMGYSSLHQLWMLPFSEIKIDRSFVSSAMKDNKSRAIVESIVNLAEKLNVPTVAEGIETIGDLAFVTSAGCTTGQGFGIAEPMPHWRFDRWLSFAETTSHQQEVLLAAA